MTITIRGNLTYQTWIAEEGGRIYPLHQPVATVRAAMRQALKAKYVDQVQVIEYVDAHDGRIIWPSAEPARAD